MERRLSSGNEASVIYSGRTLVRARRRLNSWETWNDRLGGGPLLVVRSGSFELLAPQGMMLNSRELIIKSIHAEMWLDKLGWGGTPLGAKACIRIVGRDQRSRHIDLALSPRDGLQKAWEALVHSGVTPRAERVTGVAEAPPVMD